MLTQQGALRYLNDPALADLLKLLAGFPLAIQVVLGNLPRQNPDEVLAALRAGNVDLDQGDPQDKTTSILGCIDYAFSNLAPAWQKLLLCLAPFASVLYVLGLSAYSAALQRQPGLAELPFADWDKLLQEAAQRGLLGPHPQFEGFLSLQPVLPFFLRSCLKDPAQAQMKTAVEEAFREHYYRLAGELYQLMKSKQPQEKQIGQVFTGLEYENLYTALQLALTAKTSILNPYAALFYYLDAIHDDTGGLALGVAVLDKLNDYPAKVLQGRLGSELVSVVDSIANRHLKLKHFADAEASYRKELDIYENSLEPGEELRGGTIAGIWHQLGAVAQGQRQWEQADDNYHKALAIFIEFNDRHAQGIIYFQLGTMSEMRQQRAEAGNYYLQALTIFAEYQDEHCLGITLRNLAHLWQTGVVPDLSQRVAEVLGMSAEDVAAQFAT